MPTEVGRKTAIKRVKLPHGGEVSVPVITEISFIDPNDRGQEIQCSIDNSANGNRDVRVDTLGSNFAVERVITWKLFDPSERGQETQVTFDNLTGHNSTPPHFSAHLKTHVVTYKNTPDDGNFVKSELIDQFAVIDPNDRGQETIYTLNQPQTDEAAQADPSDPNIANLAGGIDPPWRTDPFQNIIEVNETSDTFLTLTIMFGFALKVPNTSYGYDAICVGPIPPPDAGVLWGGHAHPMSLKVRVQPPGEGWTYSGIPESERREPWEAPADDLIGPNHIGFPVYAQITKDEGTAFQIEDLSTGEQHSWDDYGSNLHFSIKYWDLTLGDTIYQACPFGIGQQGGSFCKLQNAPYEFPAEEFDLSSATITNNSNPTVGPIVYHAIGTQNSYIPSDDNLYENMNHPPPYNMKITQGRPSSISPSYFLYDLPFFGGEVETMYSISVGDIVDPSYLDHPPSQESPGYVDDMKKGYYLSVTVLFRKEEPTGTA